MNDLDSVASPKRGVISSFLAGLSSPMKGLGHLLAHPGLIPYALLPLLVVLGCVVISWTIWNHYDDELLQSLGGGGEGWWSWILSALSIFLFSLFAWLFTTTIGMVLAGPFNDILAVKVMLSRDDVDAVHEHPFLPGMGIALLDAAKLLLFKIPLLILGLVFQPLMPFISIFIVAFDFFDLPWSHQVKGLRGRLDCFRGEGATFWGFGLVHFLLFLIPFFGLLLMPLAVVGAALLVKPRVYRP